jgi:thiamine pyrophosphokinase
MGITADIAIGDFDSVNKETYERLIKSKIEIKEYPVIKDKTDTELAVEYALDKGCNEILLIAALGTRLDHSFANVSLLKYIIERGSKGIILNKNNEIHLINNKIKLSGKAGDKLSLIPMTQKVCGITTKGLYYPLKNAEIAFGSSYGISNEFVEEEAFISIEEGLLLVIKARD